jgi:predicted acyl esterase
MRRFTITLAAAGVLALGVAPVASAYIPANATHENVYFPSADGTTLHADVFKPKNVAPGTKMPVILSIGPYFNHTGQTGVADGAYDPTATEPNPRFQDLIEEGKPLEKGYALVFADLRGFGASEGCNDFGGVGEQADAKAAIEWAAAQPWSTGKVGTWGKSYDGWTQVMAIANKPKGLAAAVIQSPIIDGYRTLYQNGVHYDVGWYATPGLYQSIDATTASPFDDPEYFQHSALGTNPACYGANIAQQTAFIDRDNGFWRSRDLVPRAAGSKVPVLWSHGFVDANTKPDNFLDVFGRLGGPKHAWFGQYPHVRPQDKDARRKSVVGREGFIDEAMRWMDRYVKGDESSDVEGDPTITVEDGGLQKYRAEPAWPPADTATATIPLKDGTVVDQPGNDGETGPGNGVWSVTAPLEHDVHLAGVPRLSIHAVTQSPRLNLFALLYDINERNEARLVTRAAYAAKGPADTPVFDLYPQDWTLKAGHRIGVLMAESDDGWYTPVPSLQEAQLSEGVLTFPALTHERTSFLESQPTQFEKTRGKPFPVPAEALAEPVAADLPPRMKKAKRKRR